MSYRAHSEGPIGAIRMGLMGFLSAILLCTIAGASAPSPVGSGAGKGSVPPHNHPVTGAKLYAISPGLDFDPKAKQIYLESRVCLDSGILEFLLVQGKHKAYESALSTEVSPSQTMTAMLLLGWKPEDSLNIILLAGKDTLPLTRLIRNRDTTVAVGRPLHWRLTGSNYAETRTGKSPFAADREGIHIALVDRSEALLQVQGEKKNPYHNAYFGYEMNRSARPKSGTAITLILEKAGP